MSNFKKIILAMLCVAMLIGSFSACSSCQGNTQLTDTTLTDTNNEAEEPKTTVLVGQFTDKKITNAQVAIEVVKDIATDLGLDNATDELTVESEHTVDHLTYYRLQQNYQGIPVYGGSFVVVSDAEGTAQGLSSQGTDISNLNITPSVTRETVFNHLTDYLKSIVLMPELSDEKLTIYCDEQMDIPVLAYKLDILVGGEPYVAVVNAQSGEILKAFTTLNTADNPIPTVEDMLKDCVDVYDADEKYFCTQIYSLDKTQYLWLQVGKESFLFNWDGEKRYFYDGSRMLDHKNKVVDISEWEEREDPFIQKLYVLEKAKKDKWDNVIYTPLTPMNEPQAVTQNATAKLLVEKLANAQGFFATLFGRDGYDDQNGQIVAVFDDQGYKENAYSANWNGKTIICIGVNEPIHTDLVAHEYMHSVERSISNMDSSGQSGALKEATSDIFGELIEAWVDGKCDWIHNAKSSGSRNIADPSKTKNPSKYIDDTHWDKDQEVHQNSTVISHAGYLMTQSATGGTALTQKELAKLWYHTIYTLPMACTFNAFRQNMLMVAKSLNYTEDQIKCITAAFDAVSVTGIDNDKATAWETYGTEFDLQVYGEDMSFYDDYTIDIVKFGGFGANETIKVNGEVDEDGHIAVKNAKPVTIELPVGRYTITVKDGQNTSNSVNKNIKISSQSNDKTLYFATTFGSVAETTKPADTQAPAQTDKPDEPTDTQEPAQTEKPEEPILPASQGLAFTSNGDGTCSVRGIGTCKDKNVVIPNRSPAGDRVIDIGDMAFIECRNIETIFIPDGVVDIGMGAFAHCSAMKNIDIPDSVTNIGKQAFVGCFQLQTITIPKGVTCIEWGIFAQCNSLESISIPVSVTMIMDEAIYGSSLKDIYYSGSRKQWEAISIGENNDDIETATIHYLAQEEEQIASQGLAFTSNGDGTCSVSGIGTCKDKNVVIPNRSSAGDKVVAIGNSAFHGCSNLKGITIPSGVTDIGRSAFNGCTDLTSCVIPNGVKNIGDGAFGSCLNLSGIVLPNSVTYIGEYAFNGCISLTNMTIPNGVDAIRNAAFQNCSNLVDITISDSVISIGDHAFNGCSSLKSIMIPDSVTSLGVYAFSDCSSLTNVTIGNKVKSIEKQTFHYCKELEHIVIPDSVERIEENAFTFCYDLKSVIIGKGVKTIEDGAFNHCDAITDIYYAGTEEEWQTISVGYYNNGKFNKATIHYNYKP